MWSFRAYSSHFVSCIEPTHTDINLAKKLEWLLTVVWLRLPRLYIIFVYLFFHNIMKEPFTQKRCWAWSFRDTVNDHRWKNGKGEQYCYRKHCLLQSFSRHQEYKETESCHQQIRQNEVDDKVVWATTHVNHAVCTGVVIACFGNGF